MDGGNAPVRGAINNESRAAQLRDFTGLQYGNITPTDIDAFMEYHDKCYVIIEAKYKTTPIPDGQHLALKRLCDDLGKIKPTILIVASHEYEVYEKIDFAKCQTEKVRLGGTWRYPDQEISVRKTIDVFLKKHG